MNLTSYELSAFDAGHLPCQECRNRAADVVRDGRALCLECDGDTKPEDEDPREAGRLCRWYQE